MRNNQEIILNSRHGWLGWWPRTGIKAIIDPENTRVFEFLVEEKDNSHYYRDLKVLKDITGYGVSLNTSFNLHSRTIVRTPEDAVVDFIDCNIDELFIEGYRVKRK